MFWLEKTVKSHDNFKLSQASTLRGLKSFGQVSFYRLLDRVICTNSFCSPFFIIRRNSKVICLEKEKILVT
jgi:hypothetical protein